MVKMKPCVLYVSVCLEETKFIVEKIVDCSLVSENVKFFKKTFKVYKLYNIPYKWREEIKHDSSQ